MSEPTTHSHRLGTAFHESFALNRPAIQQVLDIARQSPENLTFDGLRATTNLGRNYVKSMPRYCIGCGLLAEDNTLTPFGRVVVAHDPGLQKAQTQWLMHYFLSVEGGSGPLFWRDLVVTHLRIGSAVDADQVAGWVSESVLRTGAKPLAERTLRDTARVFLRTYSRDDGLGQIGLISESKQHKGQYVVRMPSPPGAWVIGAALTDLWQRRWPHQATTNLGDVSESLGDIFFMGHSGLADALRELQRHELIDIYRVAPPFQVVKTWEHAADAWSRLYE